MTERFSVTVKLKSDYYNDISVGKRKTNIADDPESITSDTGRDIGFAIGYAMQALKSYLSPQDIEAMVLAISEGIE